MYWIYLTIFIVVVFVPDIVQKGFLFFREESVEELLIFLLGGLGFALFMIREKQITKNREEKSKFLRDANRMSKELTSSYSYIGEANRKIDIFKNISLGLSEWANMTKEKEQEIFDYIMAATGILAKTSKYMIVFLDSKNCKILSELKSNDSLKYDKVESYCKTKERKIIENDDFILIPSPEDIDNITAILVLGKSKGSSYYIEDTDIMKALAAQALFLYVFSRKRDIL